MTRLEKANVFWYFVRYIYYYYDWIFILSLSFTFLKDTVMWEIKRARADNFLSLLCVLYCLEFCFLVKFLASLFFQYFACCTALLLCCFIDLHASMFFLYQGEITSGETNSHQTPVLNWDIGTGNIVTCPFRHDIIIEVNMLTFVLVCIDGYNTVYCDSYSLDMIQENSDLKKKKNKKMLSHD